MPINSFKLSAKTLFTALFIPSLVSASPTPVPKSITTPNIVDSKIGTLRFKDGYPTKNTPQLIQGALNFQHGVDVFMNTIQGVSLYALRKGFLDFGVKDNDVLLFSKLMDSKSLFLTGNADTVYYISFVDLSKGPMVVVAPPDALGIIDDMWFRWISDFGIGGSERGKGGKYLIVGPNYDGPLPDDGFSVRKSRTNRVVVLGRSFLQDNDPAPTVDIIKKNLRIYPYAAGSDGTSVATYLDGKVSKLGKVEKSEPAAPRFVEGTGMPINTIPPNDYTHFEMLDALVQMEPAEALDPEIAGQFEAIGIKKGKKFSPTKEMKESLTQAATVANAMSRTMGMGALPAGKFRYYGDKSQWWNPLWVGGYLFKNPPPTITAKGAIASENTGARKLHSRTGFFYSATGITPLMCMRIPGVGSQYLLANLDKDGNILDGAKTYKIVLPKNIPAARFWSITLYDNQSRSMLQTAQVYPRAGSQSYPSPAAKADASGKTTIYIGPKQPDGVDRGNWIQTDPNKGWFTVLRLYSPLQSFFSKSWRPSEITLVNKA